MVRVSLVTVLWLMLGFSKGHAEVLDLRSWLEKSDDYKSGYMLGWAEGITTGLASDNDVGHEWRSALRKCLRGKSGQQLVYAVERYLVEDVFLENVPVEDLSRINEPVADYVSPALVQLCAGQLPN